MPARLLLIGCGKMGAAVLKSSAPQFDAVVVDPTQPPSSLSYSLWLAKPELIAADFVPDIVLVAVKPQQLAEILPFYGRYSRAVFLSIAAGQAIPRLQSLLGGAHFAVVRAMPNLPASLGQGMTVAVAAPNVTPQQKELCAQLLLPTGQLAWTQEEGSLDAVTALSGSGPAYFFAFAEALVEGGKALGLDKALAERLARQTLIGSAALIAQSKDSLSLLRGAVTSKGGTTAAALDEFSADNKLTEIVAKAMHAAFLRAKELAR